MVVLHLPTNVGGNSWGLAQAEKEIGIDARVLVLRNSWLNYPTDIDLRWNEKGKLQKVFDLLKTFYTIERNYDVLHFDFGTSLVDIENMGLYLFDLPFYSKNKKIIFTYNGCDARMKYKTMNRYDYSACHRDNCYGGMCNSKRRDLLKEKKIRKAAKYASHIFALNPDLLWNLPAGATFLPYAIANLHGETPLKYNIGKTLKILHAPTQRIAKGTDIIITALEKLQKKYGNKIETIIVEGIPNREAFALYQQADIVVDQILVGWYGGFAVEVMRMGKPVAVFIRDEDMVFIPEQMKLGLYDAIININPNTIAERLEQCIEDTTLLKRKSEAGLDYVRMWHEPKYVAGITKSVYEK